jgi:hypothetical protein
VYYRCFIPPSLRPGPFQHCYLYIGGMPHRLKSISRRHLLMAGCSQVARLLMAQRNCRAFPSCACVMHIDVERVQTCGAAFFLKYHILFSGRLRNTQGMLTTHTTDCQTLCKHILCSSSIFFVAFTTLCFSNSL